MSTPFQWRECLWRKCFICNKWKYTQINPGQTWFFSSSLVQYEIRPSHQHSEEFSRNTRGSRRSGGRVFEVVIIFVAPVPFSFAVHVYDLTKPLKQFKKIIAFKLERWWRYSHVTRISGHATGRDRSWSGKDHLIENECYKIFSFFWPCRLVKWSSE